MIRHDIPHTLHQLPGMTNAIEALAAENEALRSLMEAALRAASAAAKGARLVEVHGAAVVFVGAAEWEAMRRAMIAAGRAMVQPAGKLN